MVINKPAFIRPVMILLAFMLVLTGCKEDENDRNQISKPVLETIDSFLNDLIAGNGEHAANTLVPELRNAKGTKMVSDAITALQSRNILSAPPYEIVLYSINGEIFGAHHEITYQLQRNNSWMLVHIGMDDVYGRFFGVTEVNFRYLPMPLQELNGFTFTGKPWKHYVVLAICIAIIALVGWSFFLLLRTKTSQPWIRFTWVFLIGIGMVRVTFNWTSGEITLYPMGGVGQQILYHLGWVIGVVHNSRYEPWYIQFMFPLGAVIFLWRRKALIAIAEAEEGKNV